MRFLNDHAIDAEKRRTQTERTREFWAKNRRTCGKLIVFEGIDGSGKSTQAKLLFDYLTAAKMQEAAATPNKISMPIQSFEPTKGFYGKILRDKMAAGEVLDPVKALKLLVLDRQEHTSELINPALNNDQTVILDRYVYSTLAYQRGAGSQRYIIEVNGFAPEPDLVVYLAIEPELALERIKKSRAAVTSMETLENLRGCHEVFEDLATLPYFLRIDANLEPKRILSLVIAAVANL